MWIQTTIDGNFSLEGEGPRTGQSIRLTFYPAPTDYGYKIMRVDVPERPVINVLSKKAVVTSTDFGMSVFENNYSIDSVDTVLHALYTCGVDNCLIEVNAREFPSISDAENIIKSKIKEIGIIERYSEIIY